MLDDLNLIKQRDPADALGAAGAVDKQTTFDAVIAADGFWPREFQNVVLAGMGGSALAADMVKVLVEGWLHLPVVVIKGYDLPGFVNQQSLVITISHSGNTEETLSCYQQAQQQGCQLAALASGGQLIERAVADEAPHVVVPAGAQPRLSTIYHLRGIVRLLQHFQVIDGDLYQQIADAQSWLAAETARWLPTVPQAENYAKQVALFAAGKTAVFAAGPLTWPLAYKWKISWNESAKNVAFWNQYPEYNHNEFIGWTSHPVDKPFAIFDLRSSLERPRIRQRMELTDRLLSGQRPKAAAIELQDETLLRQLLWGLVFADMSSIYTAILNGVNPTPVPLVEKLKTELAAL